MLIRPKRIFVGILLLFAAVLILELAARFLFGFGNPPLTVEHPQIEYLAKPNQDIRRFGNRILVNQYGMRSEAFPETSQGEFRVLVFGDSIVHGDSRTDHDLLATSLLKENLEATGADDVVVANISAGSWGPGNWLAYAQEYGFFDAAVVVVVISSHDYVDTPTFEPIDENKYPTTKPAFALSELYDRYLPRILNKMNPSQASGEPPAPTAEQRQQDEEASLTYLDNFLRLAKSHTDRVLVFQHWESMEIKADSAKVGHLKILEVCRENDIVPIQLRPYFEAAMRSGESPYKDSIHPSPVGHRVIAEAILENL